MTAEREPSRVSRRQDRKPKVFCSRCGKSHRMKFVPGHHLCPVCGNLVPQRKRPYEGPVDTKKGPA